MKKGYTSKRTNRLTISFSDEELRNIDAYCKRNKEKSRAVFIRKTIIKKVMQDILDDYPTLFDQSDLDKLIVKENYN